MAGNDLSFGPFRVNRAARSVAGPSGTVELPSRAFDLLMALLATPGQTLTKSELLDAAWPGVAVEENTLHVHMSALRKALPADMIVTVHGRGYKYAGPPLSRDAPIVAGEEPARKPVIVVLPFDNLSGDPEQQYFSDGITADITERLSRFRGFAVIGQHSARAFRAVTDLAVIREALKAEFVVSGSVRRAGGRLRVAANLAIAATGEAVWAQHYDRPVEDLFEVQDDVANLVAAAVARLLEIEITTRSGAKHPANLSSYEHLLQGHWHFRKLTLASNLAARESYQRACQLDPRNADALSWLGVTYSNDWLQIFSREDAVRGANLCDEAVSLDPANAHGHAMVGFAQLCVGNLDAAVHASEQAMSLNPGDTNVLANRSYVVTFEGRTDEARRLIDRARRLNPLPPIWYAEFESLIEFVEGRYEQALAGVEAVPEAAWDVMYTLACYGHLGMRDKARATLANFDQDNLQADFQFGASHEPFRDPAVRERLMEGLRKALSF